MKYLHKDERGLVAIIVTMVLMLVITITVLSFAQIIRREQREALDNQLSSQAYYAAESGINDVRSYIKNNLDGEPKIKTVCGNDRNYTLDTMVDASNDVEYTCVLVNDSPKTLRRNLSQSSSSWVVPLKPSSPSDRIQTLTFSWNAVTTSTGPGSCTTSPASFATNLQKASVYRSCFGMIRIDVTPVRNLSRAALLANTFSGLLMPSQSSPSPVPYSSGMNINRGNAQQAIKKSASCNTTTCSVTLSNLNVSGSTDYYARVSTIYQDAPAFTITGKSTAGNDISFKDAQIMIDATGRAQDVLRRIQVRIPVNFDGLHADNAITTNDSLCKKFKTYYNPNDTGAVYNNQTLGC